MKIKIYVLYFSSLLLCVSCSEIQKNTQNNNQINSQLNSQKQTAAKTSYEHMRIGSAFFLQKNYQKAIEPYQRALDLEKEQPKLDKNLWRVLIDNLAMSYGLTKQNEKAKEVLEYGISKDPDYPLFYYIMSCVYAETNDEDNAIVYLKRAFERKDNVIRGESMPDPAKDDSFQHLMKSKKFLKTLKEIKQNTK